MFFNGCIKLKKVVPCLFFVSAGVAYSQEFQYFKLKEKRSEIPFPPLKGEDKIRTTLQAKLLLEKIFTHQDAKVEHLGVDVAKEAQNFTTESEQITDIKEYYTKLGLLFLSNRDLHTNYSAPQRTLCYRNLLPFVAERVGESSVVISAIKKDAPIVALFPDLEKISVGDELIEYQGVSAFEAAKLKAHLGAGANVDAYVNGGIRALYWNPGSKPIPDDDEIVVKFAKVDGETYSLTIPWITRVDLACLRGTPPSHRFQRKNEKLYKRFEQALEEEQFLIKAAFENAQRGAGATLIDTKEPEIRYAILEQPQGRIGYLRLESFAPEKTTDNEAVEIVQKLLINEFKDTVGLIIDLKSNPGGNINYADKLAQIFLPTEKELLQFRIRATPELKFFFENQKSEMALDSQKMLSYINPALESGKPYSDLFAIGREASVHSRGTSYFKNIVLLTNSSCYSSCDMFSSTLQDHGRVFVVGADSTTGAGGANVVTSNDLYNTLKDNAKGPFQLLPNMQGMRVAFRQAVRGQSHKGELLEDLGVVSDHIIRSTTKDLLEQDKERLQKIGVILSSLPARNSSVYFADKAETLSFAPPSQLTREAAQNLQANVNRDESISVELELNEVDLVELLQNGNLLTTTEVAGVNHLKLLLGESTFNRDVSAGYVEVRAYTLKNNRKTQIAFLKKNYRIMPELLSPPVSIATLDDAKNLEFYNFENKNEDGWQISSNASQGVSFRMGKENSPQYVSGINSELALRTTPTATSHLKFKASLDSEKDFDFFQVIVFADGKYTALSEPMSGKFEEKEFDFDLSPWANKKALVLFRFTSDDNTELSGPVVKAIHLSF